MIPEFELVMEAPENSFLGCRMCLPDENTLAREIEEAKKLESGDAKVEYILKEGKRYVRVYGRVVRRIDCTKKLSWLSEVEECLKTKRGFELLNATKAHLSQLDPIIRPYADWFQWPDISKPAPQLKFRPIS
jgi:hypothetical protein